METWKSPRAGYERGAHPPPADPGFFCGLSQGVAELRNRLAEINPKSICNIDSATEYALAALGL